MLLLRPAQEARPEVSQVEPDGVSGRTPGGLPERRQDGMSGHAQAPVRQLEEGRQGELPAEVRAGLLVQGLRELVKNGTRKNP